MRLRILLPLLAALTGFFSCPAAGPALADSPDEAADYRLVAREGRGLLLEHSGQRLLLLRGDPFEIGYQQGSLLGAEIGEAVGLLEALSLARQPFGLGEAWEEARRHLPGRYIEELSGLARGAGVPEEKVFLLNAFPGLLDSSGALAFDEAAAGHLLHGHALDELAGMVSAGAVVTRVVSPREGNSFLAPGYPGLVGVFTGMNEHSLAVGGRETPSTPGWDGLPMVFALRRVLEEAGTLREASSVLRGAPRPRGYQALVSDGAAGDGRLFSALPGKFEVIDTAALDRPLAGEPGPARGISVLAGDDFYPALRLALSEIYGEIDYSSLARTLAPGAAENRLLEAIFDLSEGRAWLSAGGPAPEDGQRRELVGYSLAGLFEYLADNEHTRGIKAGRLEIEELRAARPEADGRVLEALAVFEVLPDDIFWETKTGPGHPDFDFFSLDFNSLVRTPWPVNNAVYGHYYRSRHGEGTRPSVVLPDIDGKFAVTGLIARRLAGWGVNSLVVALPFSGPRRPEEGSSPEAGAGFDDVEAWARQSVSDVRVAAAWLGARPENESDRVGIAGVSLGGIVASLAAGVDGGFERAAFILAGGDLPGASSAAPGPGEAAPLSPFSPSTYVSRLDRTFVLMVNAGADENIPAGQVWRLHRSLPRAEIHWYPGDHRALARHFEEVINLLGEHFTGEKPLFPGTDALPGEEEEGEENEE